MAGSDVGDHLGDEEWVVFGTLLFIERIVTGFLLEGVEAADTGGYDNAYPVAVEVGSLLQAGVGHGLTGGHERILGVEVELTEFLAVDMVGGVEALYLAGKLSLKLRGVEVCDRCCTAFAFKGGGPGGLDIIAQRGYGAEACHYYSLKFHILKGGKIVGKRWIGEKKESRHPPEGRMPGCGIAVGYS
jgi:hypothetical protein